MTEDPLLGQELANYRVERILGQGGMACVYYGTDTKLNRAVAIKVIDARYKDNPVFAERFVQEARAVATLRHENIIQVYAADDHNGLYYFVTEYIKGLDLEKLLSFYKEKDELLPHEDILYIARAIAKALDCTHKQGIIHRDVKPSNIMVDSEKRVILTDFGLSLDMDEGSLGEVFGSSHYISPEQAQRSSDAVPESDLYSLGVILYEMLTGSVPFDDPSPTATALQHLTQPLPSAREINPNLSEDIELLLEIALSKTPRERYSSGEKLIDELEKALTSPSPNSLAQEKKTTAPSLEEMLAQHLKPEPESSPIVEEGQKESHSAPPSLAPKDDLLGKQLDEYHIDEMIGQGGMARVYRGKDTNLDRNVAIKVIDSPYRSDSDHIERFKKEAKTIAQLEHPNIIRLYRYGQTEGLLYMAMQYIKGADFETTLAKYHAENAQISPQETIRIMKQVCEALDYAHSQKVIHRDIKPSNILIDEEGRIFVTDFGLALMTELGTQGEIFGSQHYIPPEQAMSSANAVPQSDFYSVGVILYEIFTGQLPFDAEDPLEIAMKHMSEKPPSPSKIRPEISPELETFLIKALEKEPENRYQNGAELVAALEKALPIETDEKTEKETEKKQEKESPPPAEEKSTESPPKTKPQIPTPKEPNDEIWLVDEPLPPVPAAVTGQKPRASLLPSLLAIPRENRPSPFLLGVAVGVISTLLLIILILLLFQYFLSG